MNSKFKKPFGLELNKNKTFSTNKTNTGSDNDLVFKTIIKQARKSGVLNLSGRCLEEVPEAVWRINIDVPEEGKSVSLDECEDRWWEQVDLTKLILASNSLGRLSEDVCLLPALTVLDLHDNHITCLPVSLGQLVHLVRLNLSQNCLREMPESVFKLTRLTSLHLQHNSISSLHGDFACLCNLEELLLSHNSIQQLPASICHLSRLLTLDLSHNKLTSIPLEFNSLTNLKSLDLSHNDIRDVPQQQQEQQQQQTKQQQQQLAELHRLELLYLNNNKLTTFPCLHKCTALKELYIGNNHIECLDGECFSGLASIVVLDLRANKLKQLPLDVCRLTTLQRINLADNHLSSLPTRMGKMANLRLILLEGNNFKSLRRDIIQRGTEELKKYLRSRIVDEDDGDDNNNNNKNKNTNDTKNQKSNLSEQQNNNNNNDNDMNIDEFTLSSSKQLDLSNRKLTEIAESLFKMAAKHAVTRVNFSKNNLLEFPPGLNLLEGHLNDLNLHNTRLSSIPPSISSFTKLSFLDLSVNQLNSLPASMTELQSLREVNLSYNRFTEVPAVLYSLCNLEVLLISDNKITTLDAQAIRGLAKLTSLDVGNNDIASIPPGLGFCTQLRSLNIVGNSYRNISSSVTSRGTLSLLQYLRDRIPVSQ